MKTDRAKFHLDAFNRLLDEFLPKANTVTTKDNVETARCVRRTQFHPWPPDIGMELGEFVYSLRSGLEQLAWNLALPESRVQFAKDVCFPIIEGANSEARRNLKKALALFPADVAKEIDAVQPYKGPGSPQDHPLWQLQKLSNLDKHCLIPVHSRTKTIYVPPYGLYTALPEEDAVEVSVSLINKHYFDLDPDAPAEVEIGEWETDWFIPRYRLSDIYGFIAYTVIPSFLKVDRPVMVDVKLKVGKIRPR